MDRNTAVMTWREVCGSDAVMASLAPTGRMLEEFARRIEAAEHKRCAKLAEDRLQQMTSDRAQALRWRDQLDSALTVCRCAGRVIDSSAYQGVSDEDCDLEVAVRNWRALGSNV